MHVREIQTVACLGTGTMGHGIAFLAAKAGYNVRLFGRSPESIAKGLAAMDRAIALYEDNGLMPQGAGTALKDRITGTTSLEEAASGADLVMESVAEVLEVKQRVFAEAERFCRPGAILATNTSSLSLADISKALQRPELFLAIHFFTPPYLMPLVEVCPVPATLPSALALGVRWVESLGNVPVVMEKEAQGFIVNRIQCACLREALHIVEQGWASPETVDKAISLSLGRRYFATGPIESADMAGLEIFSTVLSQLSPALGTRTDPGPLMSQAMEQGHLGLKTGKGIYEWPPEVLAARRNAREQSLIAFLKQTQALRETKG